jgi:hypothetical protein
MSKVVKPKAESLVVFSAVTASELYGLSYKAVYEPDAPTFLATEERLQKLRPDDTSFLSSLMEKFIGYALMPNLDTSSHHWMAFKKDALLKMGVASMEALQTMREEDSFAFLDAMSRLENAYCKAVPKRFQNLSSR